MSQTYASGESARLTRKLNPADVTLYANIDVGVSKGRFYFANGTQKEWVSFTGKSTSGSEYLYTGLTRGLSQTADPATAGTGGTWLANQQFVLVSMHDQLVDKQEGITPASFTTTQRDALTVANGAFIYNSTAGLPQIYYGGAWYDFNTAGSATPNASTTVAGKVEIATTAESKAGTDTGGTGANLVVLPSDIAKNNQSSTFVYAADAGVSDTYVITLAPALTAYTTGQLIRFKPNTSNTGAATLNVNALGAKSIKLIDGTDPLDADLTAGRTYDLIYDGTNLVLQMVPQRASNAEATTGTNTLNFIVPAQLSAATTAISFSWAQAKRVTQVNFTSTPTAFPLDAEDFDTGTYHDNVTNNSRLTIPATAKYRICFSGELSGGSATLYYAIFDLRKNGSSVFTRNVTTVNNASATYLAIDIEYIASATAADYYEMFVSTSNVSAAFSMSTGGGANNTFFNIQRLF